MYLLTLDPDTDDAKSRLVEDDMILMVIQRMFPPYGRLKEGQAFIVRKADYMEDFEMEAQSIGRPDLRLMIGGQSG